ncbi:MAG: SPFH domain-containing protein [Mycobacteriales bacterium]
MELFIIGVVVGVIVFAFLLFKLMWRVAEPNEALIISGLRDHSDSGDTAESLGFKIVTGKGTFVIPGIQTVRRLSLDLREAELAIECVTKQGIPLGVRGVVIFKIGDDYASIANAARRFLDQQQQMDARVHNVFAGHLRAIVGQLTVEEMIRDREKLTQLTRASSGMEMEKLGLNVDSLQVQEIDDPTGYITNLGRPHAAAVASQARIAQASADREATEREQEAEALKAEARRHSQIKQSGYQAEIDEAAARAKQAGPLSDATAHQEVVVQETRVAELEAQREEQRLQATVRKPADAKAYEQVTLAKAERDSRIAQAEGQKQVVTLDAAAQAERVKVAAAADAEHVRLEASARAESVTAIGAAEASATRAKGLAVADARRASGLAEAESIRARAEALAENQDAVIGQQLAENWPAIVEAAAKPFGNVDQMILLNGAQGISDVLAQALSQGATGLALARNLLSGASKSSEPTGHDSNGKVTNAIAPSDAAKQGKA